MFCRLTSSCMSTCMYTVICYLISDTILIVGITENISLQPKHRTSSSHDQQENAASTNCRLNKFVRRLHEMLSAERNGDIVEWRRGLLVLHSIDRFSAEVLPKYFNTRNFKTFRRQLNYYGEYSLHRLQSDRSDKRIYDM